MTTAANTTTATARTEEELDALTANYPTSLWGPRPEPVRCFCGHANCPGLDRS